MNRFRLIDTFLQVQHRDNLNHTDVYQKRGHVTWLAKIMIIACKERFSAIQHSRIAKKEGILAYGKIRVGGFGRLLGRARIRWHGTGHFLMVLPDSLPYLDC